MMWDAAPGKAVPLWLQRMPWHRGVMRLTTGWCFTVFLPKSHELSKCCGLYSTNQIAANGELHCVKTPFDKAVRFVPRQHPPRGETVGVERHAQTLRQTCLVERLSPCCISQGTGSTRRGAASYRTSSRSRSCRACRIHPYCRPRRKL